ncbi:MAG: glycosyltransferase [Proteobacteria bacterium]|nr:glycosyltransferase [Pseudomonadota bacterium]
MDDSGQLGRGFEGSTAFEVRAVNTAPPLEVLQEFALPRSPESLELRLRLEGELYYDPEGGISTYGPAKLSFNSYFNSFYEAYWARYTVVRSLALSLSGEGRVWCDVYRENDVCGTALISRSLIELKPGEPVLIPLEIRSEADGAPGRLFVDLRAHRPITITRMAWITPQAPINPVRLGVGICTFNREAWVARTLESVLGAPTRAAVGAVVVVNQGAPLRSPAITTLGGRERARLRIVDQDNFGGAGGFTRSAMELLKDRTLTHVLFMDDDIELDPRQLLTTAAFLRYASKRLVLGGHMLDLLRRHILYEAGNQISPENLLRPNHHDLDLRDLQALSELSRVSHAHFNGWWYSAIPTSCLREFGLPAPVFIRGDDLEYGTRLHRAGVETVSPPPVSVWHEPFYAKPPGWQLYYDLRNRLILASLYNDMVSMEPPARLMKLLMAHLIRYDYQHARMMALALDDFLKGPALVAEGLPETHRRVMAEINTLAPAKMTAALGLSDGDAGFKPKRSFLQRRMLGSYLRVMLGKPRRLGTGIFYTDMALQWLRLGPSYVLASRGGHFFQRYTHSRRESWRQTRGTMRAIGRYARDRGRAAEAWREAHPRLTSHESWCERLGLSGGLEPLASAA